MLEELKNLKSEMEVLKNTVKSLTSIKDEGKVIKKIIEDLKREINYLKTANKETALRVKCMEDELPDETDDES